MYVFYGIEKMTSVTCIVMREKLDVYKGDLFSLASISYARQTTQVQDLCDKATS